MSTEPTHPITLMSELELLELNLEWMALVDEMDLTNALEPEGFDFSWRMFKEAYIRGYVKGKHCKKYNNKTNTTT